MVFKNSMLPSSKPLKQSNKSNSAFTQASYRLNSSRSKKEKNVKIRI